VRWMMRNRFHSAEHIQNYRGPLLQVHGTADLIVPFEMGKQLFDAAPSANKRFIVVEDGDHNGPQPEEFYKAVDEFLDALPQATLEAVNGNAMNGNGHK
jgi:uncharacterized protein